MNEAETRGTTIGHSDLSPFRRFAASDQPFLLCLGILGGTYVLLVLAMVWADFRYTSASGLLSALGSREIQYAIQLSLISCTASALLSLVVSIPLGYLLSRQEFRG